jgi:hypothetical protein
MGHPRICALVLAAVFHWPDDREEPDRITIGYTTIGLNLNVVLLFSGALFRRAEAAFPGRGRSLSASPTPYWACSLSPSTSH